MNFFKKYIYCKFNFIIIIYLFIVITSAGCGIKPLVAQVEAPQQVVILGPGDVLEIKFSYTPELDEMQTVRPDGKISLQLVGEVDVNGKTPSDFQNELTNIYSTQLKNPEITVIVRSLYSRRVYVSGDVRNPGVIDIPGQMTALEAIMASGGFSLGTAALNNVSVIRFKNGQRYKYKLNLKRKLNVKDEMPFFLEPYDIVYVHQNKYASVNNFISNLFPRILVGTFGVFIFREFLF